MNDLAKLLNNQYLVYTESIYYGVTYMNFEIKSYIQGQHSYRWYCRVR